MSDDIEDQEQEQEQEQGQEKPAKKLLRLVSDAAMIFFKDQYKIPNVLIDVHDHNEILRVESSAFKRYLAKLFYDKEDEVIGSDSIKSVIQILQAIAEHEGETYPLSLRTAWDNDDNIIYDMTNDKWQYVKISRNGWELVDNTLIPMFSRYSQTPQAIPDRSYQGDEFGRFLKLINLKEDEDKILLSVYIITLFIPNIPHIILQIHGEKGSAKSTCQTLIKLTVDPAKPKLLTIYNDLKEFIQQLAHNYIAFYDNVKYTPRWLSDEACKAVTGVGSTKRKLYSDDDDIVYEYRRCLGFNGINLGLTEPDILDRSILIELQRIKNENTKTDAEIMAEFLELRPKLLAYIFDTIVKAMNIKPTIRLNDLPRMADSALWGEAIARAMGYKDLQFIGAYYDNIGKQNIEAIENSPLTQAITKLIRTNEGVPMWEAPMSESYKQLNMIAAENNFDTKSKSWPKSTQSLSRKLKPLLSNLREGLGIDVSIERSTAGDKKTRNTSILRVSQIAPLAPLAPLDENQARNESGNSGAITDSGDTLLHRDLIPPPNETQNPAQNPESGGSGGSGGICDTVRVCEDQGSEDQGDSSSFKCYHPSCGFHTDDEREYERHGAQRHMKNPLLYPSKAEIEKYGLNPQGKEWEV